VLVATDEERTRVTRSLFADAALGCGARSRVK
jgi:hypothetical protein